MLPFPSSSLVSDRVFSARPWTIWLWVVALVFFSASASRGQSVRWEPGSGTLARDQVSQLSLVFQDTEPKETPVPPAVPGLTFDTNPGRSEQSSFNLSFGSKAVSQRTVIYTYRVRASGSGSEVRIPAFSVDTDAGPLTVPAAGFTLAAATVGQTGIPVDQIANIRLEAPASPVWEGEVIRLTHVLEVRRNRYVASDTIDWRQPQLAVEPWSTAKKETRRRDGQEISLETRTARALAPAAGRLELGPVSQDIGIVTATDIFGRAVGDRYTLTSAPATLEIRPLPTPAPADFNGAVGNFTLTGKVVPEKAVVGEPITWTLTLAGTGNWPAIDRLPARELSRDFRVVSPRAQKTPEKDALFDATLSEDLVLIPQKPGRTTLGPYTLSVFNPSTGRYETLRTEPVVVEIAPGAATPPIPQAQTNASGGTPGAVSSALSAPSTPPAPVAKLPSDPLPLGPIAATPFAAWPQTLLWTLPSLLIPVALWLILAARHARRHDPLRPRREAHARLNQIIARLEISSGSAAGTPPPPAELLEWQQATRMLFDLGSVMPSARDLPDPAWSRLWAETERVLYRPATSLPADWFAQAREAHARAAPPPRSPLAPLRAAHLFPRAALFAGLIAGSFFLFPTPAPAADARASYLAGDFPAAEKAWRETVSTTPLAWPARHDLSLALAQQGKWDEAAAHAWAATLQAPRMPETRRLLEVTLPKASFPLPRIPSLALLLSPRQWQLLAMAAATALLLAPALYLGARYRGQPVRFAGHATLIASVLTLAAASLALRAYGPAAHPSAALVWRASTLRAVPTDAGGQKVTSALPAGTLARIDKTFLGWRRLVLSDGSTGWVRTESLTGLWNTP